MGSLLKEVRKIKPMVQSLSGNLEPTVYGIIDRVDNIDGKLVPNIIRRWKGVIGDMVETDEKPTVLLVAKLEPAILKHKKYKALFGGRGGMKTRFAHHPAMREWSRLRSTHETPLRFPIFQMLCARGPHS